MKNSLFKRAFAAVAAVPLALTQCLTYSSYAVTTNDSTKPSADDISVLEDTKQAYTLKDNFLYIPEDQIESTWYSDFYAQLKEMGSQKSTGTIKTENIVNSLLSYAGSYRDIADELVKAIDKEAEYTVSTDGDIEITANVGNVDLSFLTKSAQDSINKKFDELKAEYEDTKKEIAEKLRIPEYEFNTLTIDKQAIADKYDISVEELDKYNITIEDIAEKLDVPVETFEDVETIDDFDDIVPTFKFDSVNFSGKFVIVIEGSDLANGNTFDVQAKYIADEAVNGKTVFAVGDAAEFVLAKLKDIQDCADRKSVV